MHEQCRYILKSSRKLKAFSDQDKDSVTAEKEWVLSEEQTYRDTAKVPDDDNPFASPRQNSTGKISVNFPTSEWLCKKLERLNITLAEGYTSKPSEASGLQCDQFIKTPRLQSEWYVLHSDKESICSSVSYTYESARFNSFYSLNAIFSGMLSTPPALRPISQENQTKWERAAKETSHI